jgi:DNA-binding beta-propeller fold protein YncE
MLSWMLLITFHGAPQTVMAYPDHGGDPIVPKGILDPPPSNHVELRGLALVEPGVLWIVNGGQSASEILRYVGSGTSYTPGRTVISYEKGSATEALWHPFDFTFDPDGSTTYVSNQDTDVVARYKHDADFKTLTELPVNPKLPSGHYLRSTFVASSCGDLPGVEPTKPVPEAEGGLGFDLEGGKLQHSVRGVLWTNNVLYVADEPGDAVRAYDHEGNYHPAKPGEATLTAPVHLAPIGDDLLVSAAGGVFVSDLHAADPAKLDFKQIIALKGAAGTAYDPKKQLLYVANRDKATIHVYELKRSSAKTGQLLPAPLRQARVPPLRAE